MTWRYILPYVLVMAGVTYLIRMLPLAALRKRIKNRFFLSLLYYVPYAVLSAMTFPAVFYATGSVLAGGAAVAVALVLAWKEQSLLTVAVAASVGALIVLAIGG
ncbi:MAG: AzlD domain-containing protein [Clostridia bacterium]|nr:AzlD domain-containing protein [Clostridia bacterium]